MPYVKLDCSITRSTIWLEDSDTVRVWIYLLTQADADGFVSVTLPAIARDNLLSLSRTEEILNKFTAPDPYSRDSSNEGRRIRIHREPEWSVEILNYAKYRAKTFTNAEKCRAYRERRRNEADSDTKRVETTPGDTKSVKTTPDRHRPTPDDTQAEAEAKAEAEVQVLLETCTGFQREVQGCCTVPAPNPPPPPRNPTHRPLSSDAKTSDDAPPQEPRKKPRNGKPVCPHDDIIALYHETLPGLPKVRIWNGRRSKILQTRWAEDPERQNLEWWKGFFRYVGESDFLTGRKSDWKADLEWLVTAGNFAKVLNGRYHSRDPTGRPAPLSSVGRRTMENLKAWMEAHSDQGNGD